MVSSWVVQGVVLGVEYDDESLGVQGGLGEVEPTWDRQQRLLRLDDQIYLWDHRVTMDLLHLQTSPTSVSFTFYRVDTKR